MALVAKHGAVRSAPCYEFLADCECSFIFLFHDHALQIAVLPGAFDIDVHARPLGARQRPFLLRARHELFAGMADVQQHLGLLVPAVLFAFEEVVEDDVGEKESRGVASTDTHASLNRSVSRVFDPNSFEFGSSPNERVNDEEFAPVDLQLARLSLHGWSERRVHTKRNGNGKRREGQEEESANKQGWRNHDLLGLLTVISVTFHRRKAQIRKGG